MRSKAYHACDLPVFIDSMPDDVRTMMVEWRCPECRQKWRVHVGHGHQRGEKIGRRRRWKGNR